MASYHKVLISGIPPTLHKEPLITLLLEFGDMVTLFVGEANVSDDYKSGYAVYESKLECYRAIAELNEQPPNFLKLRYGGMAIDEEINVNVKPEVSVLHSALVHGTQANHTSKSRLLSRRFIHRTWGHVVVGEFVEREDTSYHSWRKEHGVVGARGSRFCPNRRGRGVNSLDSMATGGSRDYQVFCGPSSRKQSPDIMKRSNHAPQPKEAEDRCFYCGMVSDNACEKCGATYCSEICLQKDWNMHKRECVPMNNARKESSPRLENVKCDKSPAGQFKEEESSLQSENIKHDKSPVSQFKKECLSKSSYRKKSVDVSHKDCDDDSDDSHDWLSVSGSVDEECPSVPVHKSNGPTSGRKCVGKRGMRLSSQIRAGKKRDSMESEFFSENGDGQFKCDKSPKEGLLRGNTVKKDVAREKDSHLKYKSASPKENFVRVNSLESCISEKKDDNVKCSAKESVSKGIAIKSDRIIEKNEDDLIHFLSTPKKDGATGDSMKSVARDKRDYHLKCNSALPEKLVKTRNSVDGDIVSQKTNEPSKITPTSKGAIPKRYAVTSDCLSEKKDESLKSFQLKNGVIKSQFNGKGCDEIVEGTGIGRTFYGGKPTRGLNGTDIDNNFCCDWVKSSLIKGGNDLSCDAALRSQCDNIRGSRDMSIEKQNEKKSNPKVTSARVSPLQESMTTLNVDVMRTKNDAESLQKSEIKGKGEVSLKSEKSTNPGVTALARMSPSQANVRKFAHDVTQTTKCDSKGVEEKVKDIPSLLSIQLNFQPTQEQLSQKITTCNNIPLAHNIRKLDFDTFQCIENSYNYDQKAIKEIPSLLSIKLNVQPKQELLRPKITALCQVSPMSSKMRKLDVGTFRETDCVNNSTSKTEKEIPSLLSIKVPVLPDGKIGKVEKVISQEMPGTNGSESIRARWNLFSNNPETEIVNYDLCTQQKKLPTEAFLQVKILSLVKPGEYWVQSFDEEELNVIQKLLRNKKTPPSTFEPDLGEYCCVLNCDVWYRGRILFVKETEYMVALIDFGRIISAKAEQIEELPLVAKNFYAQAIRVRLDPRTPAEYLNCKDGVIQFMKAKGTIQDGVTNVQLKGILYAQEVAVPMQLSLPDHGQKGDGDPSSTNRSQWPSSVLCLLNEGDEASCTVLSVELSEEEYGDEAVVAIGFESIADELESILVNLQCDCMEEGASTECNPVIGDLVAAFSVKLNFWVRSIVLDVGHGHWLVAGIDFGTVEVVTEILNIPDDKEYRRIHALSAVFKVKLSAYDREDLFCEGRIEENAKLFAKVLKKKEDSLECQLFSSEERPYCCVTMRAWYPKPDCSPYETMNAKKVLPCPPLNVVCVKSGCPVIMVTYYDSLVIYVQPGDVRSNFIMEELHQIIANTAATNGPLKEDPVVGKKYICRYRGDMKYYRAIVRRVKSPKEIHVHYMDYGNKETVPREHLYELPAECEGIPCYGVKIELKKDFDHTLSNSARRFLSHLIQDRKVLTLNFPDGDLRSAELLFCGNSLIDNIKKLMNP